MSRRPWSSKLLFAPRRDRQPSSPKVVAIRSDVIKGRRSTAKTPIHLVRQADGGSITKTGYPRCAILAILPGKVVISVACSGGSRTAAGYPGPQRGIDELPLSKSSMSVAVLHPSPDADVHAANRCRLCGHGLEHTFVDLGMSPLCESFLAPAQLDAMEPFFPLHAQICETCLLVQLSEYVSPESIFREYAYFSSYSTSWIAHAKAYCAMIQARLDLGSDSLVVELASNDGYLLQHFLPLERAGARHRTSGQCRQGRDRQGDRDAYRFLRCRARGQARGGRQARGSDRRQQRAGAGPRPQRFRRGHGPAPQARGRHHLGVSASRAADRRRTSSTRSITSTSRISRSSPSSISRNGMV